MQTYEWKSRITEYDIHLEQILNVKDEHLTDKITDVNEWNRLSLDDFDKVFSEDMNKVIDEKLLPHIKDLKPSSDLDYNYLNM